MVGPHLPRLPTPVPTALDHSPMDNLPLELKQHVYSFLSPKELKPLRLTCKVFATAAECYILHRFTLFDHPDSLTVLYNVINHETLKKHLTTIVYDPSSVPNYFTFEKWHSKVGGTLPSPQWSDYQPKSITLSTDGSWDSSMTRIMHDAGDRYEAAWDGIHRAEYARWKRYQDLLRFQSSKGLCEELKRVMNNAFKKCRLLKHIVMSSQHSTITEEIRTHVLDVDLSCSPRIEYTLSESAITLWDIMPQLSSLTLIEVDLLEHPGSGDARIMVLSNLKHLRVTLEAEYPRIDNLAEIFRNARCLETLTLSVARCDVTRIVESIRSDRLRACLLELGYVTEDALVDLLLHHANTLERLGLGRGRCSAGSWLSTFQRISLQLPALERIQLESLSPEAHNHARFSLEYESLAQSFVLRGGEPPETEYMDGDGSIDIHIKCPPHSWKRGRGLFVNHNHDEDIGKFAEELAPGLWQDYDDIAQERWNGVDGDGEENVEDEAG